LALLWTQADIDALKAALASGVRRVRYRGPPEREVEYQDLKAMRDLLASMVADVQGTGATRLAVTRKGV
jgi:hypothetical protein